MADIQDILADANEALRPIIEAAYHAGRDAGRREAANDLRAKLASVIGGDELSSTDKSTEVHTSLTNQGDVASSSEEDGRATPGTVKPMVLKLISEARNGITTRDIVRATGFKHNSVRGTLWALRKDGLITKDENKRWVASPQEYSPDDLMAAIYPPPTNEPSNG